MLVASHAESAAKHKQREQPANAWRNVSSEGARKIAPVVHVRIINGSGEDVATRRRTPAVEVSSSDLSWSWPSDPLELPMLKEQRRGLSLEFKIVTGNEWNEPIATLQMPCRKAVQIPGRTVREALLWNRKRVLRRRFAGAKKDATDAPPEVFYAGELTVSVTYHRRANAVGGGGSKSGGVGKKTTIIPLGYGGDGDEAEEIERDFLEVVIQKVAAHGDDGTHAGSSTRVWVSSFAIILYFCVGILFYVYHEAFKFIDALWLCVATITTVGFGDVKPVTEGGRLFTAFFVLVGYTLVGVAVGMITAYVVEQQQRKRKMLIQKAQALALGGDEISMDGSVAVPVSGAGESDGLDLGLGKKSREASGTQGGETAGGGGGAAGETNEGGATLAVSASQDSSSAETLSPGKCCSKERKAATLDWIKTVIPVLIVIALGIVVMMVVDEFTFIQSFYWALATGTTVGYGDIVPKSEATKWFGCLYVFLVVAATARIVGKISDMFLASSGAADVAKILGKKPDAAFLQSLDKDGSGDVTELEYLSAMLVRLQFVEQDKVNQIMKAFHKLDVDGSGTLSIDDLVADMGKDDEDENTDLVEPSPGGVYSFSAKAVSTKSTNGASKSSNSSAVASASSARVVGEKNEDGGAGDGKDDHGGAGGNAAGANDDIIAEAEELLATPVSDQSAAANQGPEAKEEPEATGPEVIGLEATGPEATGPETSGTIEPETAAASAVGAPIDERQEQDTTVTEDSLADRAKSISGTGGPAAPVQAVADDADADDPVLCVAHAMYTFEAAGETELSFAAGDKIQVTEMDNADGWWHGKIGDTFGAFPYGYVYCNLQRDGKNFLLLPNDWAVHQSSGKKAKLGTWEPNKMQLMPVGGGSAEDWSDAQLV